MATSAPARIRISEAQYLERNFRPDYDYVDGNLEERNVGDEAHSSFQTRLPFAIEEDRKRLDFRVRTEYRLKVGPQRYRVPDIQIIPPSAPRDPVALQPPLAIIEITSPKDALGDILERCEEYLAMGVPHVWIVDPRRRRAWSAEANQLHEVTDGILRVTNPDFVIDLAAVFADIDHA